MVLVDIQLKTGNGLDLIERIEAHDESIRILVWSMYPDAVYAERVLRTAPWAISTSKTPRNDIVDGIRSVRDGKVYLCGETANRLLGQVVGGGNRLKASGVESLSDRELEVFRLVGQGLSTAQIAGQFHRHNHTVEAHRQAIGAS